MNMRPARNTLLLGAVCLSTAGGCSVEMGLDGEADPSVGTVEQALYANGDIMWPLSRSTLQNIGVCWENPNNAPGSTATAKAAWRDKRRRAVETSWAHFGRITFFGWDGPNPTSPQSCTNGQSGLHVRICSTSDSLCAGLPASQSNNPANGQSGFLLNGVSNAIRLNRTHGEAVAVHEFGHALGFYHEEEIPNATSPGSTGSCQQQSYPNSDPKFYGGYDRDGIMSYCSPPTSAPWLSANDISAIQRSYGRKIEGSLVSPRANCVSASTAQGHNTPGFMWDCDEALDDQEWKDWPSDSSHKFLYTVAGGAAICLGASSAVKGANVSARNCSTLEDWRFEDMNIRGFGGLCLDLRNGDTTNGTPIQVWACGAAGGANQKWSIGNDKLIRYGSGNKCARIVSNKLVIWTCNSNWSSQKFSFNGGKIVRDSGGECLDVIGPNDASYIAGNGLPGNGAQVQEYPCNTAMNQKWNLSGEIRYGADQGLCLDRKWGGDSPGTGLHLWSCNSGQAQQWDYYF